MKRILLTCLVLLSFISHAYDPGGRESITHVGNVFARSIVYDANGFPEWAVYNEQGGHTKINDLDPESASLSKIYSAVTLRGYFDKLAAMEERYGKSNVDLLSKREYESQLQGPGIQTQDGVKIDKLPTLDKGDFAIALPVKAKRFNRDGNKIETLVFPFDINVEKSTALQEGHTSVMVGVDGLFIKVSKDRIGKLTAFYTLHDKVEDSTEYEYTSYNKKLFAGQGYKILDPMVLVEIEGITGYIDALTVTDNTGAYSLKMFPPPCPGFDYFPEGYSRARLYYANFNPSGFPAIPYYLERTSYNYCNGLRELLVGQPSFGALNAYNTITGTLIAGGENIHYFNFPVGISVMAGAATLKDAELRKDGPTEYFAEQKDDTNFTMIETDYDGDNVIDPTKRGLINDEGFFEEKGDGEIYGVFLTGSPRGKAGVKDEKQPNFTRILDIAMNNQDQGLVKFISEDDLTETDIYAFRESTGDLITERKGLRKDEVDPPRDRTIGASLVNKSDAFSYTFAIRSPEDTSSNKRSNFANWEDWQVASKMNPKLYGHNSDFIRTGEKIRIVAINRATGYMGSTTTTFGATRVDSDITTYVDTLVMAPPNLKVWATRRYEPQGLLKNADDLRNTISNEGAATTDDIVIEVHTEWLDNGEFEGMPLPDGLKGRGYTGRMVKVVGNDGEFQSGVKEFAISPGRHMQVWSLGEGQKVGKAEQFHFYVQVNGRSINEENDFSTGKQLDPDLIHRPSLYVPIKVPLYNEQLTKEITFKQKEAEAALEEAGTEPSEEEKSEEVPLFDWVYRPELSFSVVDLAIKEIYDEKDLGDNFRINYVDDHDPVFLTQDDLIQVIFNLSSSEYDRITPLDGEQEFIFAIGDKEISATIHQGTGDDQTIEFTNLDYLNEIEAEDYQIMSLYLNQDTQNILWKYGFRREGLTVTSSSDKGSNQAKSFIICPDGTPTTVCEPQDPITVQLVADLKQGDTIAWKVEALKGNTGETDYDAVTESEKEKANGKTKLWKVGRYDADSDAKGINANAGRYGEAWQHKPQEAASIAFLSFMPDMSDEAHLPETHTAKSGGTKFSDVYRHNPHVGYKITATLNNEPSFTVDVKMDHVDVIRQEYINHIVSVPTDIKNIITVPERDELKSKSELGATLKGDWGQPYYDYVFNKHLLLLAAKARAALNTEPEHMFTPPNTTTSDTLPAGNILLNKLRMNSAWRNPERNERITSVGSNTPHGNVTSRHMVGRAVDLGVSDVDGYGRGTTNRAKLLWQLWRAIDKTPKVQDGVQIRWLLENAKGSDSSSHGGEESVYLLMGGTSNGGSVSMTFDDTDDQGANGESPGDGIPDIFNWASHIHLESMPIRGQGN